MVNPKAALLTFVGLSVALTLAVTSSPSASATRPPDAPCNKAHPCPTTTTLTTTTTPPTETTTSTTTSTTTTATSTTTPPSNGVCTNPYIVLTGPGAGISDGGYYVHNNEWNAYAGTSQQLAVCSYHSWNATATVADSGDHAVQTYPNVHKDYHNWSTGAEPPLSNYPVLSSTFGMVSPGVGTYDVAYDIWLNGVPGNREIMIWTENRNQRPAGSVVATGQQLSGRTWDVWATSTNGILSFVPSDGQPITSGTMNLRAFLDWLIAEERVSSTSTLGQICYGVEVVDSGGSAATWSATDFSITDS